MNAFEAWFRIVRPPIVFISVFGAVVGALNTATFIGASLDTLAFTVMMLSAGLLAAGLMVHNDYTDLASDRVNRPKKPIPSGAIAPKTAKWVGIWLMSGAVLLALFVTLPKGVEVGYAPYGLNLFCAALTAVIVVTGIYYNREGKGAGILGHVIVAFGVGAIPYWGSIALFPSRPWLLLTLALAIFVQEIGREIMVCVGDYHGDVEAGFQTVPVRYGRKRAMFIALIFYLLFIPLILWPYYGWATTPPVFGTLYLVGGLVWAAVLVVTWVDCFRVLGSGDDAQIWAAFERDIRTITRVYIIIFQAILFIEAFAFPAIGA